MSDRAGVLARAELARGPRVSGQPADAQVVATAVVDEVQLALGISRWEADRTVDLAQRLTNVLPQTLATLEVGRLDLARARAIAQGDRADV